MKKWTAVELDDYQGVEPSGADMWSVVYLASDVDDLESKAVAQALRIRELEKALKIADEHFGYPERGESASATGCECGYCRYFRVRSPLMERGSHG